MSALQAQSYQAGMDARFAVAARHSRRVRMLRVAIPVVVGLSMLMIVAVSIFNPFRMLTTLPLDMGNLVVSGTKITMEAPHLAGFTPDQRPYELWAKTATQDLTDPNRIDLKALRAQVEMVDKSQVTMNSRNGLFDTKTQLLNLRDDVFFQSSTGYEARLSQAYVDLGKGTVSSDTPVAVKLLNGTLDANRLRITERGALVRFEGGVTMLLDAISPDQPAANGSAASGTGSNSDEPAAVNATRAPRANAK